MDRMLASYIPPVLSSIRNALDDESAGFAFDYVSAIEQLRVAFHGGCGGPRRSRRRKRWRKMADQILTGTGVALGIEIGKNFLGIGA